MNDQLFCGLALAAAAVGSSVANLPWLATAALIAAVPFVVAGVLLALGTLAERGDTASSTR
jgi:hypothetical protein